MILDHLPSAQALPTDEKWQLLDELWRELTRTVDSAPPDPATVALLESREAEYQADPPTVRMWPEVQARLAAHKLARRSRSEAARVRVRAWRSGGGNGRRTDGD